ncbi:MAG: hypothetical protein AB7P02_22365 [Alphaproteobacteria bacterium]
MAAPLSLAACALTTLLLATPAGAAEWRREADADARAERIVIGNDLGQSFGMWCGPLDPGHGGYVWAGFAVPVCGDDGPVYVEATVAGEVVELEGICFDRSRVALVGDEGRRILEAVPGLTSWAVTVFAEGRLHYAMFEAGEGARDIAAVAARGCAPALARP